MILQDCKALIWRCPPLDSDSSVSDAVDRLRQARSVRFLFSAARTGASASAIYACSSASLPMTNTHATSSLPVRTQTCYSKRYFEQEHSVSKEE